MKANPQDWKIEALENRATYFLAEQSRGEAVLKQDATYEEGIADTLAWLFDSGEKPLINLKDTPLRP